MVRFLIATYSLLVLEQLKTHLHTFHYYYNWLQLFIAFFLIEREVSKNRTTINTLVEERLIAF